MRDPAKLRILDAAEDLAVGVYQLTKSFPSDERFGLVAQMRRAAVSIGSNVIEGCHRQGNRAFVAFLHQALGSTAELSFQLRIATRLSFGRAAELSAARDETEHVKAGLIRLIVALREKGD